MAQKKARNFLVFADGDDGLAFLSENAAFQEYLDYVYAGLEGSGADALLYSVGIGALAQYPSKILPKIGQCTGFQFQNGISSYRRFSIAERFLQEGIDLPREVIKEGHRRGLDVFFDFRLNDIHDHWESSIDFLPTFKKEHPEWLNPKEIFPDYEGRCEINTSLNYLVPEVRRLKLEMIRELLENYDFDGFHLDFMRSQFYFRWDKGVSLLYLFTDFVREVRRLLDASGQRQGRHLELGIRVCPTPDGSRYAGFDIARWAKEGLIDLVTAGTGALQIDTPAYRRILDPYHIPFYPCLYGDYEKIGSSDEIMRGCAEQLLLDRPAGLYAFNTYPVERDRFQLMAEIGSLERLQGLDKIYIADVNYDYNLCHEEWRYSCNLPIPLAETTSEPAELWMKAGPDLCFDKNSMVTLKLYLKEYTNEDILEIFLNNQKLGAPSLLPVEKTYLQQWLCWDVSGRLQPENRIAVRLVKRNSSLAKYCPLSIERVHLEYRKK